MSQVLYTEVIRTMLGCADETFNVWYETNSSFNTRVSEIITAKQQLEKQLVKITQDIESVNKHMIKVKNALDEKLPQLKVFIYIIISFSHHNSPLNKIGE